jgi:hypothetical protein
VAVTVTVPGGLGVFAVGFLLIKRAVAMPLVVRLVVVMTTGSSPLVQTPPVSTVKATVAENPTRVPSATRLPLASLTVAVMVEKLFPFASTLAGAAAKVTVLAAPGFTTIVMLLVTVPLVAVTTAWPVKTLLKSAVAIPPAAVLTQELIVPRVVVKSTLVPAVTGAPKASRRVAVTVAVATPSSLRDVGFGSAERVMEAGPVIGTVVRLMFTVPLAFPLVAVTVAVPPSVLVRNAVASPPTVPTCAGTTVPTFVVKATDVPFCTGLPATSVTVAVI